MGNTYRIVELAPKVYAIVRRGKVLDKAFPSEYEATEYVCGKLEGVVETEEYLIELEV